MSRNITAALVEGELQNPRVRFGKKRRRAVAGVAAGDSARTSSVQSRARHDTGDADRAIVAERQAGLALVPQIAFAAYALSQSRIWDARGHLHPGQYCRQTFQRSIRWLRDQAALGEALERLPRLELSLLGLDGPPIGQVVATAIGRVATAETLALWIERARQSSVRGILEEIRACRSQGMQAPAPARADLATAKSAAEVREAVMREEYDGDAASRRTLEEPEPEVERAVEVRLQVPGTVRAIFEDVLDLHRAVSGHETSTAAFVEALVAEAAADGAAFERRPPPHGSTVTSMALDDSVADLEHAFAQYTRCWKDLKAYAPFPSMPGDACPSTPGASCTSRLAEYESMEPRDLERCLLELLQLENERERRIGRMLYEMSCHGDWCKLEFASAGHYAVERLGMARRTAESRVGILRALRHLPVIRAAYDDGRVGIESAWCLARMLSGRRPDAALQQRWVDYARSKSVKRLQDGIRRLRLLELEPEAQPEPPEEAQPEPSADAQPEPPAETETMPARDHSGQTPEPPASGTPKLPASETPKLPGSGSSTDNAPEPPSDAQWYASLRRAPGDTRERLRSLRLPGLYDTTGPLATLASADVCLRMRLPEDIAWALVSVMEDARSRAEAMAAQIQWDEPGAQANLTSLRAAHRFAQGGRSAPAWVGLVALLEDYVEEWDDPQNFPRREWDATYQRGGFRCEAPCCMARAYLEDHHIEYRSHQGSDEPCNQLALCTPHHKQGEHGELARCRGKAPLDVIWRLGKPGYETWWSNETQLEADDPRVLEWKRRFEASSEAG